MSLLLSFAAFTTLSTFAATPGRTVAPMIKDSEAFLHWAATPPMGWNSWDSFGTTITEDQAKSQADAMAKILKPYGWNYFTVDIQWYEPHAKGHVYVEGAPLAMDEFGRLVPATTKFPSAANGAGFKHLADHVHKKGLKFGIHLMRGIARQAVKQNTPVKGTNVHAQDIAKTSSTCSWNPDMYGVDMTKPGAQAYYDSLFEMYASWGVDLVKVDDIARPYDETQRLEIEAIRKAIDKTGRKIVLSLSPGDTPLEKGSHVDTHANMWRISDDFWDNWEPLHGMFGRLDKWTQYRRVGAWPDADMLPFGLVEFDRPTKFTKDEVRLCMSLWCIAKSPLILGSNLEKLDPFTTSILTNKEVIAVSQASTGNRQLSRKDDLIVWTADIPGSKDKYVGLFNAREKGTVYDVTKAAYQSPIVKGAPGAQVVEINASVSGSTTLTLMVTDGGDGSDFDHATWIEPTLTGPKGTLRLKDLKWTSATAGWREAVVDKAVDGQPLTLNGETVSGISTHAKSVITFDLPEGYDTFTAKGALTMGSGGKGSVGFVVLTDVAAHHLPSSSEVSVTLSDLGFTGSVNVRDLWNQKELGTVTGQFSQSLPSHGAGLYRISPTK